VQFSPVSYRRGLARRVPPVGILVRGVKSLGDRAGHLTNRRFWQKVARRVGRTPEQVLAALFASSIDMLVIPKSTHQERIRANEDFRLHLVAGGLADTRRAGSHQGHRPGPMNATSGGGPYGAPARSSRFAGLLGAARVTGMQVACGQGAVGDYGQGVVAENRLWNLGEASPGGIPHDSVTCVPP